MTWLLMRRREAQDYKCSNRKAAFGLGYADAYNGYSRFSGSDASFHPDEYNSGYDHGTRDRLKIITVCERPPIPFTYWVAFRDGQEELGGYGYGKTEDAAVADLLDNEDMS